MTTLVTPEAPSVPGGVPGAEPGRPDTGAGGHAPRPAWSIPARAGIFGLTAVLYLWDLSRVGMGNTFYAAAVKSGTESWKAFLFGSLDPGNFITVDKPPGSLWLMELAGRLFGFSTWSMLVPDALCGVATVMILYRLVRRWFGEPAAVLASSAMALTPVAVVMFRYNNPDAVLTLLLVASAWALWSAIETARTSRLVLCGALVGLAFTTKMLEAYIVLPAFGLCYLWCATPRLRRRVVQLLWGALALVVSSGWWVAVVQLWPASSRPYVGGSTDNSELNLIFGYNGFSRVLGSGGPGPGGGGAGFAGSPGVLRLFNDLIGGQVSWLLPLALVGLLGGLWLTRAGRRSDRGRAGFVLWGGWMLMYAAVFSDAKGIFHPYYTVALAPGVAAVAGAGSVALWRLGRRSRWWAPVLPACIIGTAVWAAVLLGRTPGYDGGLAEAVVVAGAVASLLMLAWLLGLRLRFLAAGAIGLAVASALAAPAAYAITTINDPPSGALASAGPSTTGGGFPVGGFGGGSGFPGAPHLSRGADAAIRRALAERFGDGGFGGRFGNGGFGGHDAGARLGGDATSVNATLLHFLESHQGRAEYLVAVAGSQAAAPFILESGKAVIAMGGFTLSDPTPTLAEFKDLVADGKVHYVLIGGGGFGGFGGFGSGGGGFAPARFGAGAVGGRPPGFAGAPGAGAGAGPAAGGRPTAGFGGAGGRTSSAVSTVETWVRAHGTAVPSAAVGGTSGGTLYYVSSSAAES